MANQTLISGFQIFAVCATN